MNRRRRLRPFRPAMEDYSLEGRVLMAAWASSDMTALVGDPTCWVSGGGTLDPDADGRPDRFGGNVKSKDGVVQGTWAHVTEDGDIFQAAPPFLTCFDDGGGNAGPPAVAGANSAFVLGTDTWNGTEGYTFELTLTDRGDPGTADRYSIIIADSNGVVVYFAVDRISDGNIQLHPPNGTAIGVASGHVPRGKWEWEKDVPRSLPCRPAGSPAKARPTVTRTGSPTASLAA